MEKKLPELTEENFKKLSQPACAVFAWRAAMRVLPVIGGMGDGLFFWPKADCQWFLQMHKEPRHSGECRNPGGLAEKLVWNAVPYPSGKAIKGSAGIPLTTVVPGFRHSPE